MRCMPPRRRDVTVFTVHNEAGPVRLACVAASKTRVLMTRKRPNLVAKRLAAEVSLKNRAISADKGGTF